MFAPSVITLAWMGILHLRLRVHLARGHDRLHDRPSELERRFH